MIRVRLLCALLAVGVIAVLFGGGHADAASGSGAGTVTYPSAEVPDASALANALASPSVTTVVFAKGDNPFSSTITVFRRTGLTLRGATRRAGDTAIASSASVAILLEECRDITIRDMTVRTTAPGGEGLRMRAVRSGTVEGFVRDVTLRNARFEAFIPVRGTVRAQGLDIAGCTLAVTDNGGAGILWEDGPDLRVTKTKFINTSTAFATAGVLVRGAAVADSEGDRARRVILTRNTIDGDFATALDLADIVDARISKNRISFPGPTYTGGGGRVGIAVRRVAASALTEDYELRRNRVRNAHTGIWLSNAGEGRLISNDLRFSGSPDADTRFGDSGCAIRIGLFGPVCSIDIDRNDLRKLRSPAPAPAVIVTPSVSADLCFPATVKNRVDPGRTVQ